MHDRSGKPHPFLIKPIINTSDPDIPRLPLCELTVNDSTHVNNEHRVITLAHLDTVHDRAFMIHHCKVKHFSLGIVLSILCWQKETVGNKQMLLVDSKLT